MLVRMMGMSLHVGDLEVQHIISWEFTKSVLGCVSRLTAVRVVLEAPIVLMVQNGATDNVPRYLSLKDVGGGQ